MKLPINASAGRLVSPITGDDRQAFAVVAIMLSFNRGRGQFCLRLCISVVPILRHLKLSNHLLQTLRHPIKGMGREVDLLHLGAHLFR